nr:hypothetical protein [Tanacetum cinerariifolium]
ALRAARAGPSAAHAGGPGHRDGPQRAAHARRVGAADRAGRGAALHRVFEAQPEKPAALRPPDRLDTRFPPRPGAQVPPGPEAGGVRVFLVPGARGAAHLGAGGKAARQRADQHARRVRAAHRCLQPGRAGGAARAAAQLRQPLLPPAVPHPPRPRARPAQPLRGAAGRVFCPGWQPAPAHGAVLRRRAAPVAGLPQRHAARPHRPERPAAHSSGAGGEGQNPAGQQPAAPAPPRSNPFATMNRLQDKVALITGAAAGMGAAHARLFVQEGAKVILTDIQEAPGKALEAELGTENALFIKHDVTQLAEWTAVVEQAENRFGPLNVLVNNAGTAMQESVENFTEANYRHIMAVNQDSVAFGMRTVVGSMRKGGAGSIINISSTAGMAGAKNGFAYVTSKFAVRGMTKAAALDLAPYNIRVNSVHPGVIETPLIADMSKEEIDQASAEIPLKRIGQATEISPLVLYLASDESSFCTGSEFIADGGSLAG